MQFLRLFALVILFICPAISFAQFRWEFGVTMAPANYLGEIGGLDKDARSSVRDMKFKVTRPSVGFFVRKKTRIPWLSLKADLQYIRIAGADSLSTIPGRTGRNLSFFNNIYQLGLQPYIYVYQAQDMFRLGKNRVDFRTYFTTGVAAIMHTPKAKYQGVTYDLRKQNTEGLTKVYSKFNVGIPIGLGIDYTVARKHRVGLEFSWTKTFTDYLDDVSAVYGDTNAMTPIAKRLSNRRGEVSAAKEDKVALAPQYFPGEMRGSPKTKDSYLLAALNYSYVLKGKSSFYKSKYNYLTGAKRRYKKRKTRAKF